MELNINNFTNIKDNGFYWLEGLQADTICGKSVLLQGSKINKLSQKGDSNLSNLSLVVGFDGKDVGGLNTVYALDSSGYISKANLSTFTEFRNTSPTACSYGDIKLFTLNGIEYLFYTTAQYLCKSYEITSSDTQFDITNPTGTTFRYTYDGTGTDPNISSTNPEIGDTVVINITNATAANNGTFTVTGSGDNYFEITNASGVAESNKTIGNNGYIRIFNEDFEDFGASQTTYRRQLIEWEDTLWAGNGNYLASLQDNSTAEGSFSAQDKQLPSGYNFRCASVNNNYLLVGMVKNDNTSQLGLWDGYSDGWNNLKPINEEIRAVANYKSGWVILVGTALYYTNGETLQLLSYLPDLKNSFSDIGVIPNGMKVIKDKIFVNGGSIGGFTRNKKGCWIYDIITNDWTFNAYIHDTSKYCLVGSGSGAIYYVPTFSRVYIGYSVSSNSQENNYFISTLNISSRNASNNDMVFISPMIHFGKKVILKKCIIEIEPDPNGYSVRSQSETPSLGITMKVADSKKGLWWYGQTNAAASDKTTIKVDGSVSDGYNVADVGDEVWILEGTNGGLRTQVTAISGKGTASESWTVSPELSGNTEGGAINLNISPFTTMDSKKTITTYDENRIYFDCGGFEVSGSCLLEFIIEATDYPIVIKNIILSYDEQSDPNK